MAAPKLTLEQIVEYIKRDLTWIEGFAAAHSNTALEQKSYNIRNLLNQLEGENDNGTRGMEKSPGI